MPFPTFRSPVGFPAGAPRPARRIVPLVLVAAALAAGAVVLGRSAGLALLLVASAALLAAAVVGARAHWAVALAAEAQGAGGIPSGPETVPGDVLTLRLQALQQRSTDKVNRALEDGRDELAHELSDAYADEALRAITAAGLPPAAPRA